MSTTIHLTADNFNGSPFDRFAYLAGYADGEKCRPDKEIKT